MEIRVGAPAVTIHADAQFLVCDLDRTRVTERSSSATRARVGSRSGRFGGEILQSLPRLHSLDSTA